MIKILDFINHPRELQVSDIAEFVNVSHEPGVKIAWIEKHDIRRYISNHLLYPVNQDGVLILYNSDRQATTDEIAQALKIDLEEHVKALVEGEANVT